MISGKAGIVHLHLGDGDSGLGLVEEGAEAELEAGGVHALVLERAPGRELVAPGVGVGAEQRGHGRTNQVRCDLVKLRQQQVSVARRP